MLAQVAGQPERSEREGKIVRYFYPQDDQFITCYLRQEDQDFVEHVEYVSRGRLIRKDYFSYVRYASEYFAPTMMLQPSTSAVSTMKTAVWPMTC